jgi:hypothetical protein
LHAPHQGPAEALFGWHIAEVFGGVRQLSEGLPGRDNEAAGIPMWRVWDAGRLAELATRTKAEKGCAASSSAEASGK